MKFENRGTTEHKRETIETITLAEYKNLPSETREWLMTNENVPKGMCDALKGLDDSAKLKDVLIEIRRVRAEVTQNRKPVSPTSFEDSRFTSFEDILKRNLDSCGVRTRVFGTTLRELGIPVRFVDGKHDGDERTTDHAWLDIYSPKDGSWIECDPGEKDFILSDKNKRERIFHDWDELKTVLDSQPRRFK